MSLFYASTCFKHHVLIIMRSKLYYTASGIITLKQVSVFFFKLLKITKITKIQFYKYEKFYYYVFILIELYFSNFSYFSNFTKKNTHLFQCDDTKGCIVQF